MPEELKDSGSVTAMAVVGFVFGLIGMMGSFIPCIGSLAFYIGIPAALISGVALGVAYSQNAKRTFAIVALTISCIGVVISGIQYFSIMGAGNKARQELERMSRPSSGANQYAPARSAVPTAALPRSEYTAVGTIKSLEFQGNNYLQIAVTTEDNKNMLIWCSGGKTRVYKVTQIVPWSELESGRKIGIIGQWIEMEGTKMLHANRIDFM